jgi:hypothetical protein
MAQKKKDEKMKLFGKELMKIPQSIKKYVAKYFVQTCILIHSIAFMQWRILYQQS